MAVASASYGNANENDGDSRNVTVSTETPSYRSLCQHYSRGCSFIVSGWMYVLFSSLYTWIYF